MLAAVLAGLCWDAALICKAWAVGCSCCVGLLGSCKPVFWGRLGPVVQERLL
jgi:hypothetical protein